MKNLISVVISFILIVSIASAVDFPSSITNLGESGIREAKTQISSDGKYLFIYGANGNFAKFDIEQALVLQTMNLPSMYNGYYQNFAVSNDYKYLFTNNSIKEEIQTNDIYSNNPTPVKTHKYLLDPQMVAANSNFCFNSEDTLIYLFSNELKYSGNHGSSQFAKCTIYSFNPITEAVNNPILTTTEFSMDYICVSNDNKYLLIAGNEHQYLYDRVADRIVDLNFMISTIPYFDNTSEHIYFQSKEGDMIVYTIGDGSFSEVFTFENEEKYKLNFFKNNRYFTSNPKEDNKYLLIYDKTNHNIADSIIIDKSISDVIVAPDSVSLYVITNDGALLNVSHPLLSDSIVLNFSKNKPFYFIGDSIKLYDQTPGSFDSRAWYVNGVMLNDTNRTAEFVPADSGFFDVELVLTLNGINYTQKKKSFLHVIEEVIAEFDYTYVKVGDSIDVTFINKSKGADLRFLWHFGDTSDLKVYSIEKNPVHRYGTNRSHSVMLMAYNDLMSDTIFKVIFITNGLKSLEEITDSTNLYNIVDESRTVYKCDKFNNTHFVYANTTYYSSSDPGYILQYAFSVICDENFETIKDDAPLEIGEILPLDDSLMLNFKRLQRNQFPLNDFSIINFFTNTKKSEVKFTELLNSDSAKVNFDLYQLYHEKNNTIGLFVNYLDIDQKYNKFLRLDHTMNVLEEKEYSINPVQTFVGNDHNSLVLLTDEGNQFGVYKFNFTDSLKFVFNISKQSKISFFDYSPNYNFYLFAYDVWNGQDSTSEFIIVRSNGALVKKVTLPLINSIKFCNKSIIVALRAYNSKPYGAGWPYITNYGNKLISIYDFLGNHLEDYYDDRILGEITNVVPLFNSRALLFGNRDKTFPYTWNEKRTLGLIYYYVDIQDIEVGIINDDDENSDSPVSMKAYPNPTTESVTVFFENDSSQTAQVMVLNSSGNEVFETTTNLEYFMANTSSLGIGTYYIQIRLNDGKTLNGKFVKVK